MDLSVDPLARDILQRVDAGPSGPTGRKLKTQEHKNSTITALTADGVGNMASMMANDGGVQTGLGGAGEAVVTISPSQLILENGKLPEFFRFKTNLPCLLLILMIIFCRPFQKPSWSQTTYGKIK
jgi:hypothetical protein